MRKRLLLVVLVGLVLAACSDGSDGSGGDNEPAAVSTTTAAVRATSTTVSADPFAIPEVIDAAYVNRVLAELYRIDGDLTRKVLSAGTIVREDTRSLRAIYNEPQVERAAISLARVLGVDRTSFKSPPGDRRVEVKRVVESTASCILAATSSDFSQVVVDPPVTSPTELDLVTLRPTQPDADPTGSNPTGWSISNEEVIQDGEPLADRARCQG